MPPISEAEYDYWCRAAAVMPPISDEEHGYWASVADAIADRRAAVEAAAGARLARRRAMAAVDRMVRATSREPSPEGSNSYTSPRVPDGDRAGLGARG